LKNWIEKDIYIIKNDLLDQNKQIMSFENFQDTYHVDTTFIEFYGIVSVMPRHWKHLINTCHNLKHKGNKLLHEIHVKIDPTPCKYFNRQSVPDLGHMRPLTWALKEADPVGLQRQSDIHAPEN